jgi:transposase
MELIDKLREKYPSLKITLVMDNARYQRCKAVMEYALEKGVKLLFLPSYSPNLNLIERLWKFVKKNALYNKYYSDFKAFKEGIDNCLNDIKDKYRNDIKSLMTLNFQIIHNPKL